MNSDRNAARRGQARPGQGGKGAPPPARPQIPFLKYLAAHLLTGIVVFVVLTFAVPGQNPLTAADVIDYVAFHMPIPVILSALLSWLISRRMALPYWAILLISLPTYLCTLFVYEMGLLMAAS
ncbi:hypothetical protein [Saccharothrix sp. NRRL B-16314]|uniref:hypothetical protein n=1 Tax=Saccharothrix sp. NRRL B-16314 TaxID=1463825 RepID=UPI0005251B86|nr:hypothetical protein [Saccharothrix sp. NRRL B-16314]